MTQASLIDTGPETGKATRLYPTPPPLCEAICRAVGSLYARIGPGYGLPTRILEPSCGTGNFVRAARELWPDALITAVDVVDYSEHVNVSADRFLRGDFVEIARHFAPTEPAYNLVIGNPDFPLAVPHIESAFSVLRPGGLLAFVLRLSFWETPTRAELLRKYPVRAFAPIVQRPSFTGNGKGDKTGVGLFVFQRGFRGRGDILPAISWR